MKDGAFIARCQPPHNSHIWLIKKMLEENDRGIVILGSSNKKNMIRNPFNIELRMQLLKDALKPEDLARLIIFGLPDFSLENGVDDAKDWGRYLYYNIVSRTQNKYLKFYYNDDRNIMLNWFKGTENEVRVDFAFFNRQDMFKELSATKVRQALLDNNIDYIKENCPQSVVNNFYALKQIWENVIENPKEDFSM